MTRISSGKPKTGAPAHANRTAYRHNPSSNLTKKILSMPINGLCPACHDQIEWRKRYRKYKPLTVPKRCVGCGEKRVKDAYHVICRVCAGKEGKCEKCLESRSLDAAKEQARAAGTPFDPSAVTVAKRTQATDNAEEAASELECEDVEEEISGSDFEDSEEEFDDSGSDE